MQTLAEIVVRLNEEMHLITQQMFGEMNDRAERPLSHRQRRRNIYEQQNETFYGQAEEVDFEEYASQEAEAVDEGEDLLDSHLYASLYPNGFPSGKEEEGKVIYSDLKSPFLTVEAQEMDPNDAQGIFSITNNVSKDIVDRIDR
jgi:hypothetical protein